MQGVRPSAPRKLCSTGKLDACKLPVLKPQQGGPSSPHQSSTLKGGSTLGLPLAFLFRTPTAARSAPALPSKYLAIWDLGRKTTFGSSSKGGCNPTMHLLFRLFVQCSFILSTQESEIKRPDTTQTGPYRVDLLSSGAQYAKKEVCTRKGGAYRTEGSELEASPTPKPFRLSTMCCVGAKFVPKTVDPCHSPVRGVKGFWDRGGLWGSIRLGETGIRSNPCFLQFNVPPGKTSNMKPPQAIGNP